MPLAVILGICLLLPWPCVSLVPSAPAAAVLQSAQPQQNQPNSSSPQNSPDQSPAAASPPCPADSQTTSTTKSDCEAAPSTAVKSKKHHRSPKAPAETPAKTGPTKTVVRNGSA